LRKIHPEVAEIMEKKKEINLGNWVGGDGDNATSRTERRVMK
jgi:hypothetical protein